MGLGRGRLMEQLILAWVASSHAIVTLRMSACLLLVRRHHMMRNFGHLLWPCGLRATQLHGDPGEGPGVMAQGPEEVLCGQVGQWPWS